MMSFLPLLFPVNPLIMAFCNLDTGDIYGNDRIIFVQYLAPSVQEGAEGERSVQNVTIRRKKTLSES